MPALLPFVQVSAYFMKVGVGRNITEDSCADWLSNLVAAPMANLLRQCRGNLESAAKYLRSVLPLLKDMYGSVDKMAKLVNLMSALDTVVDAAAAMSPVSGAASGAASRSPHAPSTIRAAIDTLEKYNPKSKVFLALLHGELGKHILDTARTCVKQSAQDEMAKKTFAYGLASLKCMGDDGDFSKYLSVLSDLNGGAVNMSAAGLEESKGDFETMKTMVRWVGESWLAHATSLLSNEFVEGVHSLAEALDQTAEASDATTPSSGIKEEEQQECSAGDALLTLPPARLTAEAASRTIALAQDMGKTFLPQLRSLQAYLQSADKTCANIHGFSVRAALLEPSFVGTCGEFAKKVTAMLQVAEDLLQAMLSVQVLAPRSKVVYRDLL